MQKRPIAALLFALLAAVPSAAQSPADIVTVGTVTAAPGATVDIPVYIRDASGTPLGLDQPPGSRIQSYALKVNYSPASAVSAIIFTRGGITAPLTPLFESSPSAPGTVSLLDTFQESTNLVPFTVNAPTPGNQVAVLHVSVSPLAPGGSTITLVLDSTLTQLANQNGTLTETTTARSLLLANGAVNVTTSLTVPALSTWGMILLGGALLVFGIKAVSSNDFLAKT
jgi:hypothetical protein